MYFTSKTWVFGSVYFPVTTVFSGSVTSTMCISFQPAKYAYVSPSGVVATWTSALPLVVRGLKSNCSKLSVPTICCDALEWSCPSCWKSGSSLSKTGDFEEVSVSPLSEKTYIALDAINKTRKKANAISLPRMVWPVYCPF